MASVWRVQGSKGADKLGLYELGECNSFTYNQSGFHLESDKLHLSKIGSVKIVLHRQPVNIKQVTMCRQAEKWYAIIGCEIAKPVFKFVDSRKSVGIDVGIIKFAHDSDDRKIENPLFLTKMLKPLRWAQRKVSRRKRGSNNRQKAKSWAAKLCELPTTETVGFLLHCLLHGSQEFFLVQRPSF